MTDQKLVYVSGAMTATPENPSMADNYARLHAGARAMFDAGHAVYCPVTTWFDEHKPYIDELVKEPYGDLYEKILKLDFTIIRQCDAIYMVKGWEHSRGARRELELAQKLKLEVWYE